MTTSETESVSLGTEKFEKLDDAAMELINRSRYTNSLHMMLSAAASDMIDLAEEGIEDNLDPGCVDVFTKTMAASYDMMKLSMTEMQGHMNKGKWG